MPVMTTTRSQPRGGRNVEVCKHEGVDAARSDAARPISVATEFVETDIEDDSSLFEEDSEHSGSSNCDSLDSRRQSQTTVSSYDVPTPRSSRQRPFEVMIKPVVGPKGPHLFRASQCSANFMFDHALQLSPLLPRTQEPLTRSKDRKAHEREEQAAAPCHEPQTALFTSQGRPAQHQDASDWTIQQVGTYMRQAGVASDVVTKLGLHDISGSILMRLQFDDLKELDIQSFGKRHQLWSAIQTLKGEDRELSTTHSQEQTRPGPNVRSKSDGDIPYSPCSDVCTSPTTPSAQSGGHRKRRHHKKNRRHRDDPVEPGESVSIVAIEQVIPKPHECSKGEDCTKWQRRERLLNAIRQEQSGNGWSGSAIRGGQIVITGNPGTPSTANKMVPHTAREQDDQRPTSGIVPSVVASSDLLGPSQLPAFALHEVTLEQVQHRDPQENVKHFLNFQHITSRHVDEPVTPPLEMFPAVHHQAFYPALDDGASIGRSDSVPPQGNRIQGSNPRSGFRDLPKLTIPRSASASPYLGAPSKVMSPSQSVQSPWHVVNQSSLKTLRSPSVPNVPVMHSNRPGSELGFPVTAVPTGPIARDTSQSVPPDMQYRDPVILQRSGSRAEWRRPSLAMPKLEEDQIFSTVSTVPPTTFPAPRCNVQRVDKNQPDRANLGIDVAHTGWMKKRKTKLLRHDWYDAHFRLHGTVLDMHENARLSAALMETIDVDEYSVTVSNIASNSKLSSALKNLKLSDKKKETRGSHGGAFAFQLIPGDKDRAKFATGKTHHFAVDNAEERIDWMRELMLAKAKKQKECGYVIEHNGEKA
ncbi:hypothetical protein AAFC00_003779 [Neodothiora populina]|uniref:Uncharacterized protein n=1 Tax=Neodothiora populina TaxID=2781224 RepID=A0ABR3PGJ7_9PEZI